MAPSTSAISYDAEAGPRSPFRADGTSMPSGWKGSESRLFERGAAERGALKAQHVETSI
jgi:hypothetical protein